MTPQFIIIAIGAAACFIASLTNKDKAMKTILAIGGWILTGILAILSRLDSIQNVLQNGK